MTKWSFSHTLNFLCWYLAGWMWREPRLSPKLPGSRSLCCCWAFGSGWSASHSGSPGNQTPARASRRKQLLFKPTKNSFHFRNVVLTFHYSGDQHVRMCVCMNTGLLWQENLVLIIYVCWLNSNLLLFFNFCSVALYYCYMRSKSFDVMTYVGSKIICQKAKNTFSDCIRMHYTSWFTLSTLGNLRTWLVSLAGARLTGASLLTWGGTGETLWVEVMLFAAVSPFSSSSSSVLWAELECEAASSSEVMNCW